MRALAAALAGVVVAVLPVTAALAADPKPDIAVTSATDKATYAEGETFTVTVTVKNKSSVDAKRVHYSGGDSERLQGVVFGELSTGFDLAANATKTFTLTGKTTHDAWRYGNGFIGFELTADNGEANDEDNVSIVRVLVPGAFAALSGYVFQGDSAGANWTPQTPGVPGVKVVATTADGKTTVGEAVTDAKGLFRFTRLPAGTTLLTFTAPAGWKILAGESGTDNKTPVQVIAEERDEPSVFVAAKQVPVSSPTPSASASGDPGLPLTGDDNTLPLVGLGSVAVVLGVALAFVARRRRVQLQA